ncbi:hypothetical protein [Primorskyibacter flagellatus]|nr:hypothetical protein [Primorskyibacter flagellatus]
MNDLIDPDVLKARGGVARAMWHTMHGNPEGETPEARKAAWMNEREDAMKLAARVLRRLEREGFTVTKTES